MSDTTDSALEKQKNTVEPKVVESKPVELNRVEPNRQDASSYLVAEFTALRDEMLKRMEIQHQLLSIALVAAVAFISFGLENKNTTALLTYPLLSMFLASAWSQSDVRIRHMGAYIRANIETKLLGEERGWENVNASDKDILSRSAKVMANSRFAARGVFVGTQIIIVILAGYTGILEVIQYVLLAIDLLAILLTYFLLGRHEIDLKKVKQD